MSEQPNELFSPERPVRSEFSRESGLSYAARRIITLCVLTALLCGGGAWLWKSKSTTIPADIPTVKAEGSYKQKPEEPGGIDIPHQDVEVYKKISGGENGSKPQVEHLLPPPETPNITPSTVPAPTGIDMNDGLQSESLLQPTTVGEPGHSEPKPLPETAPAPAVVTPSPAPVEVAPPAAAPAPPMEAPAAASKPAETKQIEKLTPPAVKKPAVVERAKEAPAVIAKGNAVVQLASSTSESEAMTRSGELKSKYRLQLGGAQLRVVRADLGAKGIYYRIQSQPMSESSAQSICRAMKAVQGGCFIVRH